MRLLSMFAGLPAVLLLSVSGVLAVQERWVYRHDGSARGNDRASSVTTGVDGNIYVAGHCQNVASNNDFTVVSLTPLGSERWVYSHDGATSGADMAYSVAAGEDGNVYAAGYSTGSTTGADFCVISLDSEGVERWTYHLNGSANGIDIARSIGVGVDGNVYVAGCTHWSSTGLDFTVVSLAPDGSARWVYRCDGYDAYNDEGVSLALGEYGVIYACGYSSDLLYGGHCFTVIGLSPDGVERWVCRIENLYGGPDVAQCIIIGTDGNLYVAGEQYTRDDFETSDFLVASLTPEGSMRWARAWSTWNCNEYANSIAVGADGNIYPAGRTCGGAGVDFTVFSLTPQGSSRWVYRFDGPGSGHDNALSIIGGPDGHVYAAGYGSWSGFTPDLAVISLSDQGTEEWVYRYSRPGNLSGVASSIAMGADGNLYAAGYSRGTRTSEDLTVVGLAPETAVEEERSKCTVQMSAFGPSRNDPNPFQRSTVISYSLPAPSDVTIEVHDATGRLVETLMNGPQEPGNHQIRWNRKANPSGVYFWKLETGRFVKTHKMVVVD